MTELKAAAIGLIAAAYLLCLIGATYVMPRTFRPPARR